jgi:hypothetical protein
MDAVHLLQKRDWKVAGKKRKGWRKEIGLVMAIKRDEAPQKKSMWENLFRNTEVQIKY